MSIPNRDKTLTNVDLEKESILFLKAGKRYWEFMQKFGIGGAVTWVKDTEGFGCVFTRGEYEETLMQNIHRLGPTHYFGSMTDKGET